MDNIKKIAIAFGVLFLFIAGSVIYALYQVEQAEDQGYKRGYTEGQAAIKPVEAKIETVKTTVYVTKKPSKPVTPTPDYDSAVIAFVNSLILDRDNLEQEIKILLEPREFFVGDSMAYARVLYFPMTGLYEGEIVHAQINTEITKVKEPPLVDMTKEKWYEDPATYIAGGATGIAAIAAGASTGVGAVIIVAGGIVIAIF